MNWEQYNEIVRGQIEKRTLEGRAPEGVRHYYEGHIQRFELSWEMLKNLTPKSVLDIGTGFPFCSMYFGLDSQVPIIYGDPTRLPDVEGNFVQLPLDLCKMKWLPPCDLVICTETLEHLWCNLYEVIDMLKAAAKRWLFLSFPCGGNNAGGYDAILADKSGNIHNHLREFTGQTALEMVARAGGKVLHERGTSTSLYQATIAHYLIEVA